MVSTSIYKFKVTLLPSTLFGCSCVYYMPIPFGQLLCCAHKRIVNIILLIYFNNVLLNAYLINNNNNESVHQKEQHASEINTIP